MVKSSSRRQFLQGAAAAGTAIPLAAGAQAARTDAGFDSLISLNGAWQFRLDPKKAGEAQGWHLPKTSSDGWTRVTVPHTWQVSPESADYLGLGWYRKSFDAPASWAGKTVRLEFEAVYHSAAVWVNGNPAGKHTGKGYTVFTLDITSALQLGTINTIAVSADNSFDPNMLPRGNSYDWTPDGGITRPVSLLITPRTFIERVAVDALPDPGARKATLEVRVAVRNTSAGAVKTQIAYDVIEDATGLTVLRRPGAATVSIAPGKAEEVALPAAVLSDPKLWHFDHPNLYRLVARIESHQVTTTFGVRKFEVRNGGFYLNGERVWLMGVERMAGSNPQFGMAEPSEWIRHDHDDMKELNCVFTRVHWQQDRRVLDYCDRHGILIQEEVPTWGPITFKDMVGEPSPAIMQNGLEQLREMIRHDCNHPSIFAWGLCNEVNGQHPAARTFVRRMKEEARKLDPHRLLSYASNSLRKTPGADVAGEMDFIEWNEYYESWYKGSVDDMRRNLEEIHRAFPDKVIVISEYGYCECTPDRKGGDARRIEILRNHDRVFQEADYVGGLIFFCYNDYRTHIGDKGLGVMKQRVHGVVDLYGTRKPSFEELRRESSPISDVRFKQEAGVIAAAIQTRKQIPAYTLSGYKLRWTVYGFDDLPMEQHEAALPKLQPGKESVVTLRSQEKNPVRLQVDVIRPTGFSAFTAMWKP